MEGNKEIIAQRWSDDFGLQKIRHLILPSRPDRAQSRQIAERRLLICCLLALSIFITIGVRIVSLADTSAGPHLSFEEA